MLISFLRALKFSLQDISRNVWLSVVTVTIIILAMLSINTLVLTRVISSGAVEAIKEKVDLSLYLKTEANETEILDLKLRIETMEKVKDVRYVSKQEALDSFQEKNQDKPEILQALLELGKNPLSPSLIIWPADINNISSLIEELKSINSDIIDSKDFSDNRLILEKINNISKKIDDIALFIIAIFIITSLLVIYNSIKVAIYTHKKEIEIMRLVGASSSFIHAPFLLSSFIYTLIAVLIIIAITFPLLSILQPYLEVFFLDYSINVFDYFSRNFLTIFGLQLLGISVVNVLASYLAIKKYARV